MTLTECLTWLEKICADMREQDVEDCGAPHRDELELLSADLRQAIFDLRSTIAALIA